jgi:hypothetical protein
MSCVLANRIILNVRELGAEPVLSQHSQAAQHIRWHSSGIRSYNAQAGSHPHVSFADGGVLKQYEMDMLRGLKSTPSMRVKAGVRTLGRR